MPETMNTNDDEVEGDGQLIANVIGHIYPALQDMESFKFYWDRFYHGLKQEPCSTLFHLFTAVFSVLPCFGFIVFITGVFLFILLCGSLAFFSMLIFGLLAFGTLAFFILICCVWLSSIFTVVFHIWHEWPYIYGGVCTIRVKALEMISDLGFFAKSPQADNDCVNGIHQRDNKRMQNDGDDDQVKLAGDNNR